MKKLLFAATVFGALNLAQAITINTPSGLNTLNGIKAYQWGVGMNLGAGERISSATLSFSNIKLVSGNWLGAGWIHTDLLDVNTDGVKVKTDYDLPGDYFQTGWLSHIPSSSVEALGTKFFSSEGTILSWSYTFNEEQLAILNDFAADGKISFGIDPDCHFTIGGISFSYDVFSQPPPSVPDGGQTVALLGFALIGLFGVQTLMRRKLVKA